jgi:hypothetical protein
MTSEERVLCFIHHAHAAAAKLASYGIVRDGLPDYGFHDSRTGKNSSCKANTGQGDSGAARAVHLREKLATSDPDQMALEYISLLSLLAYRVQEAKKR